MTALLLMESSHVMVAPWLSLSVRVLVNGNPSFEKVHGEDLWRYTASNLDHNNQGREVFDGVGSLVDVGGGNGTTMSFLAKAFPWIHGINFDLPHVIDVAPKYDKVEHVAGDMFTSVPKADAVIIKWVLHDWGDDECIQILKKCREAIPKEKGKVIIVEAVIEEEGGKHNNYKDVGLKRTLQEWTH
ncbi:hypothetical protein P8452_25442 [Trifolium repens]|nr:hypothetical protein P8452_25442 [Trifolium repens]